MKLCTVLVAVTVVAVASDSSHAQGATTAAPALCAPAGDLSFLCGPVNVEDFVPVESGRWLVGGSLTRASVGLYLIDTAAKSFKPVVLSIAARPDPAYKCLAPDLKGLANHGLDVVPGHGGLSTVYVINHVGREAVEVFKLHAAAAAAEWVGCVIMPPGASANSIAVLPKGAFAVTKFLDTNDKESFQHVLAGQVNGVVYLWTPGKGFSEVPGTQFSGDNGIVASPDGKWLFVNAWGSHEVWRVPVSGQGERSSVKVDFNPDNLRWAPDGTIFVTGQFIKGQKLEGLNGWATVRLDPKTLKITPVVQEPGYPEFDNATSTVQVAHTLWFGTFRGDRIAYRPAP